MIEMNCCDRDHCGEDEDSSERSTYLKEEERIELREVREKVKDGNCGIWTGATECQVRRV